MLFELRTRAAAIAILSLLAAACALPRDPEKTSQRISSTHELRVGVTDNPPWARASGGEPQGIEPDLVRNFAGRIGARVRWTRGSETSLVKSLKEHQLDLVIGGFDKKTQWVSTAGVSQPFAKDAEGKQRVFLAAPGENRFILTLDRFLTEQMRSSQAQS
jgi:ABC-type amino acid transport substrate-binding protein